MALIVEKAQYHVVATTEREDDQSTETPVDFEAAVSATGYGLFNVLLLLAAIPAGWTVVFDTSTIAFVIPSAECELDLTLFRKGTLAAVTFGGMICTAFFWGYIADQVGRKHLLLFGLILDAICNIFGSASQGYYIYLSFKFVSGIIIGGPFAILMTYIAEFHAERHRSKVLMWTGSLFAVGNIAVPALARAVLPLPWSFSLFDNLFVFDSWRIFLIISGLPPLIGFLTIGLLPESPKFLMTNGNSLEALKIFRKMYSMNTGKSGDTYPVKALELEYHVQKRNASVNSGISSNPSDPQKIGFSQPKSVFSAPYIIPMFIVNVVVFASTSGMQIMKSWLPQLIVILNNFDPMESEGLFSSPSICEKLNADAIEAFRTEIAIANENITENCIPMAVSPTVYTNATIIAASAVLGSFFAGFIINKVGKKNILFICLVLAGACNFALNWSPTTKIFLILCSAIIALTGISTNAVTAMIVEVVPTNLRATAVSISVLTGRLGALTGNLLFPILLNLTCDAPFYYIGGFLTLAFVVTIFLKKHSGKLE